MGPASHPLVLCGYRGCSGCKNGTSDQCLSSWFPYHLFTCQFLPNNFGAYFFSNSLAEWRKPDRYHLSYGFCENRYPGGKESPPKGKQSSKGSFGQPVRMGGLAAPGCSSSAWADGWGGTGRSWGGGGLQGFKSSPSTEASGISAPLRKSYWIQGLWFVWRWIKVFLKKSSLRYVVRIDFPPLIFFSLQMLYERVTNCSTQNTSKCDLKLQSDHNMCIHIFLFVHFLFTDALLICFYFIFF